jgi:structural maintenance of chromosome 4
MTKQNEELKRHEDEMNEAKKSIMIDGKIKELEREIKKLEKIQHEKQEEIYVVENENKEIIGELKKEESKWKRIAEKNKRSEGKLKRSINEYQSEIENIGEQIKENMNKLEENRKKQRGLEESLEKVGSEKNNLEEMLKKLTEMKSKLTDANKKLEKEIQDLKSKIDKIENKLKKIDMNNSNKRYSQKILSRLLDLQRDGKLGGILGRLGDLGSIDSKFDMAASTATGLLDYIVVDRYENAKKCIQMLKIYKIGKASFLTLDRLGQLHNQMTMKKKFPKNTKRLFDLISKIRFN